MNRKFPILIFFQVVVVVIVLSLYLQTFFIIALSHFFYLLLHTIIKKKLATTIHFLTESVFLLHIYAHVSILFGLNFLNFNFTLVNNHQD